ncbi:MAG: hypothetical protein OIN87_04290 [Candidatus Methanoperedens sp.]|nr:hypothetical protein [Candidatus Methanoperedens sp.]
MNISKIILSLFLIFSLIDPAIAGTRWINNITVNEYNITWSYTESFSGHDSNVYKVGIDSILGNNDSFISAWELLKADKEVRTTFKSSLETEMDIKINNETSGVELIDIDSTLSQATIGDINNTDTIINTYNVTYRLKDSIFNSSTIWFLGESYSPVTLVFPQGIEIKEVTGMTNASINADPHPEISGFFKELSMDRGEILLTVEKNVSFFEDKIGILTHNTSTLKDENITKPYSWISSTSSKLSIIGIGIICIIFIYVYKLRNK